MLYAICFMTILFSNLHGCRLVIDHASKNNRNYCVLHTYKHQSYRKCLRCYINKPMISLKRHAIEGHCSSIRYLHCIDLYFHDTISYLVFSSQNIYIINNLFDQEIEDSSAQRNALNIHIKYDTLKHFSYETIQPFDDIENRTYHGMQFSLNNRPDDFKLHIADDIKQTTLNVLQIIIHCDSGALYQYSYIPRDEHQRLIKSIQCTIETKVSTIQPRIFIRGTNKISSTILVSTISTENMKHKFAVLSSLVGSGSFIVCCMFAGCLYILSRQNNRKHDTDSRQRASITFSITDSISSDATQK